MPLLTRIDDWLNTRYGGKRAYLRHWRHAVHYRLGGFAPYREIRWEQVKRVWFVCTGNICRSPFAEAVGRRLGLDSRSCGLNLTEDSPADPVARRIALDFGADLSGHRSRRFVPTAVGAGDLIAAMEPAQAEAIVTALHPATDAQITLLGLWAGVPRPYLHDPYMQPDPYFQECFRIIEESVQGLGALMASGRAQADDTAASA